MKVRIISLALCVCAALLAQSPQATINGTVSDSQGGVIVGAEVSAANVQTGVKTTVKTNESGVYSLRFLPIGNYVIDASQAGFKSYSHSNITLTTGQVLGLDIQLELGAVSETVSVSASASLLETRTSDVSQLVEARSIEDMPLGDRRSMNMINMTGGAVFVAYDSGQKPNFSLAGGRTQSQMFWIDGGSGQNMRLGVGQIDTDPPVETLQEVKVMANGYAAEYGGSAGGVIVATTKSGTNQFRGSLFEYLRNNRLDAPSFFAPIAGGKKQKAPLRYNVFGGVIGGPVRRDKTFFFFSYEGSRRRDGAISTLTVPTDTQKAGDFSKTLNAQGVMIPIYDPATTRTEAGRGVRDAFAGNRIPSARFDPVALNLFKYYPVANRAPDTLAGANNFRANYVNLLTRNTFLVKVDHNLGAKDKLSGRYLYNSDDSGNTSVYPEPAADTANGTRRHQQFWYMSWTRVITPSLINEFRFTYGNRINHAFSKSIGGGWPAKLGIKGVPENAFPQIVATGFANLSNASQERRQFPIEQLQYVENLSWIRGRHAFKFGTELRSSRNYETNLPTASGAFTFNTLPTGQPGVAASGNGLATLLLGFPTGFAMRQTPVLDRKSWYLAGFVQDDWTLRKNLTLNLGVRWETDTPIMDAGDRMNSFDPNANNPVSGTPGVIRFAGVNGWPSNPYSTNMRNFGPRIGFAWKPLSSSAMVVRGGFGIFYAHPFDSGQPASAALGYEQSAQLDSPDNGITAPFYLKDGPPGLTATSPKLDDSFGAVAVGRNATTAVTYFEQNRKTGYSEQFNLSVQRELPRSMVVEATFLGNFSHRLPSANLSTNQIRPERMGPAAAQKDRPFPQFSNVTLIAPTLGDSAYLGGVLRFEKRFAKGFSILSTYTWSKFLDNTSDAGSALGASGGPYSDYYNRRADWGPSDNDIRQRLTWSSLYEVPFGKGRAHLANHPIGYLVGGWGVGSVVMLQTGPAFTVTTQTNSTNAFSAGALRADVLRPPGLAGGERTLARWFDTGAFKQPANYTFGNQGVNLLRSDAMVNFDFSILRNFNFSESKRLQFRTEIFNAFNHPNFSVPGRTLGGAGFGVVSSSFPGRRIQLGLRLTF
ncbi:MAG: carboxypeptidase regulatory-like domain-containing protein [Bryobacterales bacterium]|nr:carboxypeptidase regulatory-like domain-containing protein [Bryobacterales bacterium]